MDENIGVSSPYFQDFTFRINRVIHNDSVGVPEMYHAFEIVKGWFKEGRLTREQWFNITGMRKATVHRYQTKVIKHNLKVALNYSGINFGSVPQGLDPYQRFLLCYIGILLKINRSYEWVRNYLALDKNYSQITRRKFTQWMESNKNV